MKKILFSTFLFLLVIITVSVSALGYSLVDLQKASSDGYVTYRGTSTVVKIPDTYETQETDFRAVWVSHLVSDVPSYQSKTQYIAEMNKVFEIMEYYNMNAMIFHIRTHNNALYKSSLNPVASYYRLVDFDTWDPLQWIIEESHKRGIEFHAWMNPYRITTSNTQTLADLAATFPAYNIASDSRYLIASGSSVILNPGEPAVRNFIVDTVMEVIENYDVDGIHFDDYFYISGVDDTETRNKYNTKGLSMEDFRREQVDLFIKDLSTEMRAYNLANNRVVQLGISPSGIYQNGGYVASTNYRYDEQGTLVYPVFSNTSGFAHYGNYLFSDTKKWIDEEWIDYILPQSYWSMEHPTAPFADIMDWWSAVVKNKKVNLYSGMGLYMINEGSTYSWKTNGEAYNQLLYSTKHPEIQGHSIYSFKHIRYAYEQTTGLFYENFKLVKENAWKKPALLPETRTYDAVVLPKVENIDIQKVSSGYNIQFPGSLDAKFYAIYRSVKPITYTEAELIDVVGSEPLVSYTDKVSTGIYYYGVKAISNTNTLGEGNYADSIKYYNVTFKDYDGTVLKTESVLQGENATAPVTPLREGYIFTGWSMNYSNVNSDIEILALYKKDIKITFMIDSNVLQEVNLSDEFSLPHIPYKQGYDQVTPIWSITDFSNLTEDVIVTPIYTINKYTVKFIDIYGAVIKEEIVEWNNNATEPTPPEVEGYEFTSWDKEFSNVKSNLSVTAQYEKTESTTISCQNINLQSIFMIFSVVAILIFRKRR